MSYTGQLASRVTDRFANHVEEPVLAEFYAFSKEVALESYKNGLATGRRSKSNWKKAGVVRLSQPAEKPPALRPVRSSQ